MSPFFNTMDQNNTISPKLSGRGQLGGSLPNTMGQYHGDAPWYHNFRAQKGIRDFERSLPRVYATLSHKNCVYANPECIRGFPSQK